jgi:putative transposase
VWNPPGAPHGHESIQRGPDILDPRAGRRRREALDLAREHGVTTQTIDNCRAKYGGLEVCEAKRLRELEEENRRLKRLVADLSLDKEALKDALGKKW